MELYTIIAQIINFCILIFILNKYLYKPVMETMEKRKNEIKNKIDDTEKKLKESERLKDEYIDKLKNVEEENNILRQKANDEINKIKEFETQKINNEILEQREKFAKYLELEQKNLLNNFNTNLSEIFIKYSNYMFKTISNSTLEDQIVNVFLDKISTSNSEELKNIKSVKYENIYIFSSNQLSDRNKDIIKGTLIQNGFLFENIDFQINNDITLGLEIKIGSYCFLWDIKRITEQFISNNVIDDLKTFQ